MQAKVNLTDEWHLVTRLKLRGYAGNTFDGVTDYAQRKERVRAAIKAAQLAAVECWKLKGIEYTFAEAFESVYEEAL